MERSDSLSAKKITFSVLYQSQLIAFSSSSLSFISKPAKILLSKTEIATEYKRILLAQHFNNSFKQQNVTNIQRVSVRQYKNAMNN